MRIANDSEAFRSLFELCGRSCRETARDGYERLASEVKASGMNLDLNTMLLKQAKGDLFLVIRITNVIQGTTLVGKSALPSAPLARLEGLRCWG
jgi:hypothetical protein